MCFRSTFGSTKSGGSSPPPFESMFGMARRFPSIRLTSAAKKEEKKKKQMLDENFPREAGSEVQLSFGSLDQLYSSTSKTKDTKVLKISF